MVENHITLFVTIMVIGAILLIAAFSFISDDKKSLMAAGIGFLLLLSGGGPLLWSNQQRDNKEEAMALAQAHALAEAQAAQDAKDKAEFAYIRERVAALPVADATKVYFLHRLDPQRGFLGWSSEVNLEQARGTLKEAEAALPRVAKR